MPYSTIATALSMVDSKLARRDFVGFLRKLFPHLILKERKDGLKNLLNTQSLTTNAPDRTPSIVRWCWGHTGANLPRVG